MQKIVTLLVTGALIYMIFQHNNHQPPVPPPSALPTSSENSTNPNNDPVPAGNFLEKTASTVLLNILKTDEGRNFFEHIIKPMNDPKLNHDAGFSFSNDQIITTLFSIKTNDSNDNNSDEDKGPASCGHIVTINYSLMTMNDQVIKEGITTFPLGSEKVAPGLDAIIVGMKTGQVREAIINPKYLRDSSEEEKKGASFKAKVLLQNIIPYNFVQTDVKVFDDIIQYKLPLVCGNTVTYDARVTKLSTGEIMYDSVKNGKQVQMKIGHQHYPVIFSHALHNKIPTGTRTVIAKGRLFKSFLTDSSVIFPHTKLPVEEYFMVEFFNFPVEKVTTQHHNLP
jgi:hypothetical protein